MAQFRSMHDRFRAGKLSDSERETYYSAREQLARSLMATQNLTLEPGQSARKSFRVAHSLQVDIQFANGDVRAPTLDLSVGGFSVIMPHPPSEKEQPGFSLRLPGSVDPLIGRVRFASTSKRGNSIRASFSFVELPPKEADRLETVLFDLVLQRLP